MNPQSVIDLPTFEALKEAMGADFMIELVQAYFDETPQLLVKLQQALAGHKKALLTHSCTAALEMATILCRHQRW